MNALTVALTFDDGPSEWTPLILDALCRRDSRATFFVLGCHIAGCEDTLRRVVSEGHEIGLHGWDHAPLDELGEDAVVEHAIRTRDAVENACRAVPTLWRSPWNLTPEHAAEALAALGLTVCAADVDVRDGSIPELEIRKRLRANLRDGAVIGLHDGIAPNGEHVYVTRMPTVRAVDWLLRTCRSLTVSELLGVAA